MNKLTAFRTAKSTGLFEQDNSKDRLVKMGNPMENITRIFDFETFRATLEGLLFTKERKSNAGRRPIDCVIWYVNNNLYTRRFSVPMPKYRDTGGCCQQ